MWRRLWQKDNANMVLTNPFVSFPILQELSNGRLAMLAAIGMMGQELVNRKPVLADLPFF